MSTNNPGAAETSQETVVPAAEQKTRKSYQAPQIRTLGAVEVVTLDGGGAGADLNGTAFI